MAKKHNPATAPLGELVQAVTRELIFEPNVRKDVRGPEWKSFVSSIREEGIHQPPIAYRDEDGKIHIVMGQRRVTAALEVGHEVIPVIIKPRIDAVNEQEAERKRIEQQLAENRHRAGLTVRDSSVATQALFGLTASDVKVERIARNTHRPKKVVERELAVAGSDAALAAADAFALTLDQAALIAEFDGDAAAQDRLNAQAAEDPDQLQHIARQLRDERLDREVIDRLSAPILAAGHRVVAEYNDIPNSALPIHRLARPAEGDAAPVSLAAVGKPDPAVLESLTGLIARIGRSYTPDAPAEDRNIDVNWYVDDWKAQGLIDRWSSSAASRSTDLTDEEREAEKARRRAKREAKKAMSSATVVRRAWITETLLARGARYDKTHHRFIAGALAHAPGHLHVSGGRADDLVVEFLGLADQVENHGSFRDPLTGRYVADKLAIAFSIAGDRVDPIRFALAVAVAKTEYYVGNDREADFGQDPRTARYLGQLVDWGYTPSAVEQQVMTAAMQAAQDTLDAEAKTDTTTEEQQA